MQIPKVETANAVVSGIAVLDIDELIFNEDDLFWQAPIVKVWTDESWLED